MSNTVKWVVVAVCFSGAVYGFMIKLPVPFRTIDLELHALFYFVASVLLNIIFKAKDLKTHLLIFGLLVTFGVSIEFAQEYSNYFFNKRIHGNFDKHDIKYNLLGLTCFSSLWLAYKTITFLINKYVSRTHKT